MTYCEQCGGLGFEHKSNGQTLVKHDCPSCEGGRRPPSDRYDQKGRRETKMEKAAATHPAVEAISVLLLYYGPKVAFVVLIWNFVISQLD